MRGVAGLPEARSRAESSVVLLCRCVPPLPRAVWAAGWFHRR